MIFLLLSVGSNAFRTGKMAKHEVSKQGVLLSDWAIAPRAV